MGFCYDKNQSELETALPLNLWASATIKYQSELETMLPLNSWAPATIKHQSEQDALLPLNMISPFSWLLDSYNITRVRHANLGSADDNVMIDLWQCQMVNTNDTSNLRQCWSLVNKMIVVLFQTESNGFDIHHELIELINGLVGHIELTELISSFSSLADWLLVHLLREHKYPSWLSSQFRFQVMRELKELPLSWLLNPQLFSNWQEYARPHKLIDALISEGAQCDSNFYWLGDLDSSQLIVYIISANRASKLIDI